MAEEQTHPNEAGDPGTATRLPQDPAIADLADRGRDDFFSVVRHHPASSLCWALLAEGALLAGTAEGDIAGYAYATTGCDRGTEALRGAGWEDGRAIAWEHLSNQGFLRCVWARSVAAGRIGQPGESRRCEEFLRRASEPAWEALRTTLAPADGDRGPTGAQPASPDESVPTGPGPGGPRDDEGETSAEEAVGSTAQG